MAKLNIKQIQDRLKATLADSPKGIRWSDMVRRVRAEHPETPTNTIRGALHAFLTTNPDVQKVARGTYVLKSSQETQSSDASDGEKDQVVVTQEGGVSVTLREEDFYDPFADWLRDELEEANEVVTLGGNLLRSKWGTPDVFGVLKPRAYDHVKFSPQFVAAEIKIDPHQPIVAFGQTIAYRLFAHKSYIVLPDTISSDDLSRLDALAVIYGLGFVTFSLDKLEPNFTLRVRALNSQPDMFYVNQVAKRILDHSQDMFQQLF